MMSREQQDQVTIAWIDDEIDIIDPLMDPLRTLGYRITEYRSYGEALLALQAIAGADVAVIDLILPPGPGNHSTEIASENHLGLRLITALRANDLGRQLPILVLSVHAEFPEVSETELEVRRLAKPTRPSELKKVVLELLAAKR